MNRIKMQATVKYVVGIGLLTIGVIGFFLNDFLSFFLSENVKSKLELPLSNPKGIVVDNSQRIYVGIPFYSRVQIYNKYGDFLGSLSFDSGGGGNFRIALDNNDNLIIATLRNEMLYIYGKNGQLISKYKNKETYYKIEQKNDIEFVDKNNDRFEIRNSLLLYPRIIKVSPEGKYNKIVSPTFFSWFLMEPLPCWVFAFIGLLITVRRNIFIQKSS